MPLPTIVQIMQPTLVSCPFHHEGWASEEKVDGYRMLTYKDRRAVKRGSRQARITRSGSLRSPRRSAGGKRRA